MGGLMGIKENEYMLFLIISLFLVGFSINIAKAMRIYKPFQNIAGIAFILLLIVYYYFSDFYETVYIFLIYSVLASIFIMAFHSLKYYLDIKKYHVDYNGLKEMYRSFIIPPSGRKNEEINLELDDTDFKFNLPEKNHGNTFGMLTRFSDSTSTYEKNNDLSFPERVFFVRSWNFFRINENNAIAEVTFEVSMQKIKEYSPLNEKLNICAAAYHYLAAKYGDTETGFIFKNNNSVTASVFRNTKINNFCFLQYDIDQEYGVHNIISHIPVDNSLMLTIEVRHICYHENNLLNNIVKEFSKKIFSDMNPDITKINSKNRCCSSLGLPEPPDIKIGDHSLPDREEYRLMLRNNAKDSLQWFLFEHSGLFYPWFDDQYDKLDDMRKKSKTDKIKNIISRYISDIHTSNTNTEKK